MVDGPERTLQIELAIIGAQKAGTTSLKEYLGQHPDVVSHHTQEMAYFTDPFLREKDFSSILESHYARSSIPESSALIAKNVDLLYDEAALIRLKEHNPEIEVVIVLRNPVERAYSAYRYARQCGYEPHDTFEEALAHPPTSKSDRKEERYRDYIERSTYVPHVETVMSIFGEENTHVYLLKDLKEEPVQVCRELFSRLAVNPDFNPDVSSRHNTASELYFPSISRMVLSENRVKRRLADLLPGKVRTSIATIIQELNQTEREKPPMNDDVSDHLQDLFREHNTELSQILDRNLDHWQ